MQSFKTYLEKNLSNPLRKQELASQGVVPWTDPQFHKDTVKKSKYEMLLDRFGVQFFMPRAEYQALPREKRPELIRILNKAVLEFTNRIKDILPNRKPRVIIQDLSHNNHPTQPGGNLPAYKQENLIYIDPKYVSNVDYLVHEYAHYVADRVSGQTLPILQKEYRNLLDNYFRSVKKKQREDLALPSDDKLREKIAKKLGLPSAYSLTNPDEFFAEIIMAWKRLPNNAATYKFKQAVKHVIARV